MRKLVLVGVVVFGVVSIGVAQAAHRGATAKIAVCHKTGSGKRPYTRVVVSGAALKAAQRSADDIVPAPTSCPQALLTANGGGTAIDVDLLGVAEQPDVGDPDGTGAATLRLRKGQARVCFRFEAQGIGAATAAHIHRGGPEVSGPVVVPLGTSSGCVPATRAVVNAILASPAGYYVNMHTAEFPAGAVRGQLAPVAGVSLFTAALAGANEKPNPADANGSGAGQFLVDADKGRLCYALSARNIVLPSLAAHIHKGDASASGPVVIPFTAPNAQGVSSGCVTADATLLRDIVANPAGYYANVHTSQFAAGAVRGQLTAA
jgi:hypothetical protein